MLGQRCTPFFDAVLSCIAEAYGLELPRLYFGDLNGAAKDASAAAQDIQQLGKQIAASRHAESEMAEAPAELLNARREWARDLWLKLYVLRAVRQFSSAGLHAAFDNVRAEAARLCTLVGESVAGTDSETSYAAVRGCAESIRDSSAS